MTKRITNAEDKISVAEFREFLFDRIVPIEDVNDLKGNKIYKSLQYWRRHGLLPFFEKGEKFQLSFAQLVWLRILDHLRESSFTVKKTEKICNYFFKEAYDIGLPQKNLEFTKTNLLKKKLAFADFIIDNSGSKRGTLSQARKAWDQIGEQYGCKRKTGY